jgi:hypothetical protein
MAKLDSCLLPAWPCWSPERCFRATTLHRFLQRLDDATIDQAVGETVRRLRGARKKSRRKTRVAVDATGLAQGAVSTFFVRRMHHHGQSHCCRGIGRSGWSWRMWISSSCWLRPRDGGPGTTVRICLRSSRWLPGKPGSGLYWPTPSSTAQRITFTSGSDSARRA